MIDYYAPNIDLTLLGCGFLAYYHLGAICLLNRVWPNRPYNRICGASCGGLVAALMMSEVPMERALEGCKHLINQLRSFFKSPTSGLVSVHELLLEFVSTVLPHNAHELCDNRIGISISKATWPLQNMVASRFETRQDLVDAIVAGCFIPFWSGSLEFPLYAGTKCLDGGYSNNAPQFVYGDHHDDDDLCDSRRQLSDRAKNNNNSPRHLKVCAFASEAEISPPYKYGITLKSFGTVYYLNWLNLSRGMRTLIPYETKAYRQIFLDGFQDMKNYILNNDMIKCQQCAWAGPQHASDRWSSCLSCLKLMEKIDNLKVPQNLINLAG